MALATWKLQRLQHRQFIVLLLSLLVVSRWTFGWFALTSISATANLVSGLLYAPLLIATATMLGSPPRLPMTFVCGISIVAIIGSQRTELAGSPVGDWRIGISILVALGVFCGYLNLWAKQATAQIRLVESERQLHRLASMDELTQLLNRRAGAARLSKLFEDPQPLTLMMVDIDHFKSINDTLGHDSGDAVLRDVAQTLRRGVRERDVVCRWGGEEFLIALPGAPTVKAEQIAEKLRAKVDLECRTEACPVTISIGCAHLIAGEDEIALRKRADTALYEAKMQGRNRVVVASEPTA